MWLPWRRRHAGSAQDAVRARAALAAAQAGAVVSASVARDQHRILKENNLAPRIAEAFRLAPQQPRRPT